MHPLKVSEREYRTLAGFRSTLRGFLAFSEGAAKKEGLTPRQHQALLAVKGAGRPNIGDLAVDLGIRHNSAVGLVDRLTSLGLLARRVSLPDRREVHLRLTARGQATLERLTAAHRQELRQVGPRLKALLTTIEAGPLGEAKRPG